MQRIKMKLQWIKNKDYVIDTSTNTIYYKGKNVGVGVNFDACLQRIWILENKKVFVDKNDFKEVE